MKHPRLAGPLVRTGGAMVIEFRLGDVVRLRKVHPCGGFEWQVVRLGADIGLKCRQCQRRVLLERRVLERRLKSFVSQGKSPPGAFPFSDVESPSSSA